MKTVLEISCHGDLVKQQVLFHERQYLPRNIVNTDRGPVIATLLE